MSGLFRRDLLTLLENKFGQKELQIATLHCTRRVPLYLGDREEYTTGSEQGIIAGC